MIFCCPHCGGAFDRTDTGVVCPQGHSFDRAREGYLNLLPTGRLAGMSTPGDTPESLQARRRFLQGGWYAPVADALADALGGAQTALDVGCGEGWYLSRVGAPDTNGLDISKRAVQMAAKAQPGAQFVVAGAHRLPVLPASCDAVYSVFAPHSTSEFERVLRPGGRWVTVTPASHHLREMRPHGTTGVEARERRRNEPPAGTEHAERITFSLSLEPHAAADLFTMTPLQWQAGASSSPSSDVTVDVWVAGATTT